MRKLRAGLEQVYGIAEAQCEFQGRIRVVQVHAPHFRNLNLQVLCWQTLNNELVFFITPMPRRQLFVATPSYLGATRRT